MACFAPPYGLRYAANCFIRADAQNIPSDLIPAGGKLVVISPSEPVYRGGLNQLKRVEYRPNAPLAYDDLAPTGSAVAIGGAVVLTHAW